MGGACCVPLPFLPSIFRKRTLVWCQNRGWGVGGGGTRPLPDTPWPQTQHILRCFVELVPKRFLVSWKTLKEKGCGVCRGGGGTYRLRAWLSLRLHLLAAHHAPHALFSFRCILPLPTFDALVFFDSKTCLIDFLFALAFQKSCSEMIPAISDRD